MVDLYVLVTNKIKPITAKVYPKKAPKDAQFPYVVYRFPTTTFTSEREDTMLEIDIWDGKRDGYDVIKGIEALCDSVDKTLREERYLDDKVMVSFERVSKLDLGDSDDTIERIQLRYRLKVYKVQQ